MKIFRAAWRMSLFFGLTFGIYALWFMGAFFIPNKLYWRQLLFRYWGFGFARLAKINIKIIGTPPRPPFFLVVNHLSYADIPLIRAVVEGVYVAKKDIESWFLAGTMIRNFGNIYINRENRRDIPRDSFSRRHQHPGRYRAAV
jgi:1-acyl-sn-glycerol-3-phosphate acyltransferase